jgi:hypothetical protein
MRGRPQRHVRRVEVSYLEGKGRILPPQTTAVAAFVATASPKCEV